MSDQEMIDLVRESLGGKELDELSRIEVMRATATALVVRAAKECEKYTQLYSTRGNGDFDVGYQHGRVFTAGDIIDDIHALAPERGSHER